jgi:uncharacterized protein (DUF2336 family)
MLKALIGRVLGRSALPERMTYEMARDALETHAREARRALAQRTDVEPEVLYYLAGDESTEVRRLVAANPATPQHANKLLASDFDANVRCELARKIGRIVPGLDSRETQRVRDIAIEIMETLASDHLPRVRSILADEIKSSTRVPAQIVRRLAHDLELIVSAPVLEYSPLLSDDDLLEIIAGARVEGAMTAIARRRAVSVPVSDAIVATLDVPAVAALLTNANAQIREETLDLIIDHASEIIPWHQPVVLRPGLSVRAIRRIAGFVAASLLETLEKRTGLDADTAVFLRARMRDRLAEESLAQEQIAEEARAALSVRDASANGTLDDAFLCNAAESNARILVVQALALRAGVPVAIVNRILSSRSGKAITALVWKAGFSARAAMKVQSFCAHLSPAQTIMARDGSDYALSPDEMAWHLKYFGATV